MSPKDVRIPQKPQLLIIELNYHAEVLNTICPILAERFLISLWTTDKIWKKLSIDNTIFLRTFIMPKSMSPKTYWKTHQRILDSTDLIYFNTLERHFSFFHSLEFHCPTIVRIHNTNTSLFPIESIDWNFRQAPNILFYFLRKLILPNSWRTQKKLYKKLNLLMLPSSAIKKIMTSEIEAKGFDNIADYCLPFISVGDPTPTIDTDAITFAITGSVDPERKEYQTVISALIAFKERHPNTKIRMLLLGPPIGKSGLSVIDDFKRLADKQFSIEYFTEYVHNDVMNQKMRAVQFLIAPIRLKNKHKIHAEYYGKSKVSGVENDAVNFRKPVILPREYNLPDELKPIGYPYRDSEELLEILIELGIHQKYKNAKSEFDTMHSYRKVNIANNFYQLYQTTLRQK